MSTATSSPSGTPKNIRPAGLPDQRFWIKYSPNHELPLSVTSSVFLHALAFGLIGLILAGVLGGLFGGNRHREIKPFQLADGGGGDPNGNTTGSNESNVLNGTEITQKTKNPEPIQPLEATKPLYQPEPNTEPLVNSNEAVSRIFQDPKLSTRNLSDVAKNANVRLALAISKGQSGTGQGGGKGDGKGSGSGNQMGPGSDGAKTSDRQLRWTMIFRTTSGRDYLKQIQDLGGTLAVPEGNDEYLVFRDLHKQPLVGRKEDLGSFEGVLRWVDDRPDSVKALAHSLGLSSKPAFIVAFFDKKLEKEMADLEKRQYSGPESNIEETTFLVESRPGGKFAPKVQSVRLKK
jgi:hypothetical protein